MENSSFAPSVTPIYSTTKTTAPTPEEYLEVPHVAILCTVLSVASIVGTLGNALVLLSIIKFDNLRTIADLFIFSLSLSDFFVTTLYQPLKAYRLVHLQEISTNATYLAVSRFFGYVSLIASITNMLGVTVERLISIRFPLKYDLFISRRRAVVTLICIWIFSVTSGAIGSRGFISGLCLTIYFILSILGTVTIYIYIFFVANRLEEATVVQVQNGSFHDEEMPSMRRERKAAKTIAIILGVSLCCWLPFLIVPNLLSKNADPTLEIFFSLQVLSVCNSSINPYIYCARSRRYYVAFVKLLGIRKLGMAGAPVAPAYPPHDPAKLPEVSVELQLPRNM